jgi:elongator complex protein 3
MYDASKGKEFFIAAEYNDYLLGFCRLRFPSQELRSEITWRAALIRELHVYGESTSVGKKGKVQHKGIGKELLSKAEQIAKKNCFEKMVVISGIGAKNYYRKLGYKNEGVYMVKKI